MSGRISAQQLATGLRRELRRKVRQVGVWGTLKHGGAKLIRTLHGLFSSGKRIPDSFDLKNGTDTAGNLGVGFLDIPEGQMEHAVGYRPLSEEEFVRLIDGLSIDLKGLTFVDLGSGKGRALLMASRFGFKEVIGVELSRMLHETAERNIALFQRKYNDIAPIKSIHCDAAAFEMPLQPLLIYLYNPFDEAVMKLVLARTEESVRQHPREIYIMYVQPLNRHVLDQTQTMRLVADRGRYVLYRAEVAKPQRISAV